MKRALVLAVLCTATLSAGTVEAQTRRNPPPACTEADTSPRCVRERAAEQSRRNGLAMRAVTGLPRNYAPKRTDFSAMQTLATPTPLLQALPVGPIRTNPSSGPIRTSPQSGQIGQMSAGAGQAAPSTPGAVASTQGADFDVELFAQTIEDILDGNAVGYAYSISAGKVVAREGADGFPGCRRIRCGCSPRSGAAISPACRRR